MLKMFFGAAAILSAAIATPAPAQTIQLAEAIQEPGLYAFYHPNGDLGLGASSRPGDAMAARPALGGMRMSVRTHRAIRPSTSRHY